MKGHSSDHDNGFACLGVGSVNGVVSNGKGFNECELVIGEFVADMKFSGWDSPVCFSKPAGTVDADDLDAWAAVSVSFL